MNRGLFWRVFAAIPLLAVLGCGGGTELVKVAGKVTLDGKPLPGASVQFVPEAGTGTPANGVTGSDGSFRLTTFSTGDGARTGTYKVVIQLIDEAAEGGAVIVQPGTDPRAMAEAMKKAKDAPKSNKQKLPATYSDVKKTTLKQVVPPTGAVVLDLKSTGG